MSSLGSYFSPLLSILVFFPFSLFISLFFIHFLLRQCAIVNMEEGEGEGRRAIAGEREREGDKREREGEVEGKGGREIQGDRKGGRKGGKSR